MRKKVAIINDIFIRIILIIVYLFGVGMTSLFVKIVSLARGNRRKDSYWIGSKNFDKDDYDSAY